jgi:NitT/TauT family transport system ATP-binding protein
MEGSGPPARAGVRIKARRLSIHMSAALACCRNRERSAGGRVAFIGWIDGATGSWRTQGFQFVLEPMRIDTGPSLDDANAGGRRSVIDMRGLSLTFETADGPVEALSNINLRIDEGDFVSLIGPSGCGKTTLLRLIADLEQPSAGTLVVNGISPERARLERHYGYVFQAPALLPWRTVEKNLMLPLEIMGLSRAQQLERARHYLAMVNLSGFERKFPWQLSGGMQQRASIARALSFDPKLLLMDEPFGALDEIVRDHLNEELLGLWEKTLKTVVFVTHSIPEAVFLSTKIVVMSPRPGRIIDLLTCDFPRDRTLDFRDTTEFIAVAHRVRQGLRAGHSHDE